jgi:Erythronolide synthase docking domain
MPEQPPDNLAERAAVLTRILGAPDPGEQETAIMEALEFADQAACDAWEAANGQSPSDRLRAALRAAVAELESLTAALPEGPRL